MREFISIDFETANPQRVSACAFGFASVRDGKVIESGSYLIKPVGGHAEFQSKIHGITDEHTANQPEWGTLYPQIAHLFKQPLVAHSLFDQQVLRAMSAHYEIDFTFGYTDASAIAKRSLPQLRDHKLKTLAKHFKIQEFKHHDAKADAIACAQIFMCLIEHASAENVPVDRNAASELRGLIRGILADEEVNYKEAYGLMYWLDDHQQVALRFPSLTNTVKKLMSDQHLDLEEAKLLAQCLNATDAELMTELSAPDTSRST